MKKTELNFHNKKEYPPMHTAEHILNQTMIRLFDCERSHNAHIERKKSKCDYKLPEVPSSEQIKKIEKQVNTIIEQHLEVKDELINRTELSNSINLNKLPKEAGEILRIVKIGNYDTCACIGAHVKNTAEIGVFKIISSDYTQGIFRIRFKLLK